MRVLTIIVAVLAACAVLAAWTFARAAPASPSVTVTLPPEKPYTPPAAPGFRKPVV